ncbi:MULTISPECIES: UDP-N-acetylmuramoyl-tripeptide--D-alanyl-D-alanine ligase [unclassified Carboxylicivirga]|uniref:UDP-N-acetylmuramoyl-tripeptide--D-alanyl-D- alanine ligase n=1 Tax=Carboxylicivirga TaxID=1628153 RepID=UPI003D3557A2
MTQLASIHKAFLASQGVSTDSRAANQGTIFFALKGASFDGNKYVREVLAKGAAYAVADDKALLGEPNVFLVEDVLTCLQNLARYHRRYLNIPILAITGTNGKTTTKELVAAVLSKKYRLKATAGNFNNHIGVPLTLLSMDSSLEMGVVEMGANHIGEIDFLCRIAEPNYGLITNVGKAHLEGFGSFEGVKTAKGELYQYMHKTGGRVFINTDNKHLKAMATGLNECLSYGTQNSQITGQITAKTPFVGIRWHLPQGSSHKVNTQLIGTYNFENILSAICIGHHLGVAAEDINEALENYIPSNNRSQYIESGSNRIIMDAYNANPTSMQAALQHFAQTEAENKVLILGGMKELGADSTDEHRKLIATIESIGAAQVFLVGSEFEDLNNIPSKMIVFPDTESLIHAIDQEPVRNAYILIKGSRSNQLEKVLSHL